jgi:hypothetical protein
VGGDQAFLTVPARRGIGRRRRPGLRYGEESLEVSGITYTHYTE